MSAVIRPSIPCAVPLLTAEEFVKRYPKHYVELVKGVVKEVPMAGVEHGVINSNIGYFLADYVRKNDLGRVVSNDTYFITRRNPDVVRGMDIGYISYARLPKGPVPRGALDVAPELIVEVRSPSDAWTDVFAKVEEYLAAGVGVVVVLDPEKRSASACRRNADQQDFFVGDTLTVPDVLPGFAVPVAVLFE